MIVCDEAIHEHRSRLTHDIIDKFSEYLCKHFHIVGRSVDMRFYTIALTYVDNENGEMKIDPAIDNDPGLQLYLKGV